MQSFQWDSHFETNISEIDEQHKILLQLINKLSNLLTDGSYSLSDVTDTITHVLQYTSYHFEKEELLMYEVSIDSRHLHLHIQNHKDFIHEVSKISQSITNIFDSDTKDFLGFLTHWLTYHILGIDQNMAQQIKMIQSGQSPQDAYEQEEKQRHSSSTEPLLVALNGLFHHVSIQNRKLHLLNNSLEATIQQRTQELVKANVHLEELSLTDVLTGLPNRRHGIKILSLTWEEAVLHNLPLVCMMIDADQFKTINDTFGHDAGDQILIQLSHILHHSIRNDDMVCRLGGDEFLVICPNTDLTGGLYLAEQIRTHISQLDIPIKTDSFWSGSISIGVSVKTDDMNHFEELVKMADRGVYLSKSSGKNCVRTVQNDNL